MVIFLKGQIEYIAKMRTKSFEDFKEAIFLLCKRIIEKETVPESFKETTLHQIWKRKPGSRMEDLASNRFIHCKDWLARTVVKQMEPRITESTSRFQIGGKPGHRPQEHIFFVKSVINKYIQEKKLIIIACYDIKSFFDKYWAI